MIILSRKLDKLTIIPIFLFAEVVFADTRDPFNKARPFIHSLYIYLLVIFIIAVF